MDSYAAYVSNQTQRTIKNTEHDVQSKTLCCENDNEFVSMIIEKNLEHPPLCFQHFDRESMAEWSCGKRVPRMRRECDDMSC